MYYLFYLWVVLFGRAACLLTLKGEEKMKVLENKVSRKIFGSMRGQRNRGMEKDTYSSPNIIRVINQE